jgi:uncharacterized membrane protein
MSREDGTTPAPTGPAAEGLEHELESHVASLLRRRATRNLNALRAEERRTLGQRMSDGIARGAGSWRFITGFLVVLAIWVAVNVVAGVRHWDPYPFILLNLLLSCVAAIQAPIILMSQNREEARDRMRAEADYEVNLKAEILLEHLTKEVEALKAMLTRERDGTGKIESGA